MIIDSCGLGRYIGISTLKGGNMGIIERVIMTNFHRDYMKLTNNGFFKGLVCLMGISYFKDDVFNDEPGIFLLKNKKDFSFGKVQILLKQFSSLSRILGIKLAFADEIRLEDDITRLYEIDDEEIRCV